MGKNKERTSKSLVLNNPTPAFNKWDLAVEIAHGFNKAIEGKIALLQEGKPTTEVNELLNRVERLMMEVVNFDVDDDQGMEAVDLNDSNLD